MPHRRLSAVLAALLLPAIVIGTVPQAAAVDYGPISTVSQIPAKGTPHVLDGKVASVVQVGNTIVLGGIFTQARNEGETTVLSRSNLLAFDKTTGAISTTFVPQPNGEVTVVLPAGDGETVYVGGVFTSIGGVARKNLARVRISDGTVVEAFNATPGGRVEDLRLSRGRLWVAGRFTHIGGVAQLALGTVNPTTGKNDPYMQRVLAGVHHGGSTSVSKMDITPDGNTLVAIGNFDTVDGLKRHQILELDLSGATAALRDWQTSFFESACSSSFTTYMKDVDISPDGTFFVVGTTGAYGGTTNAACDSTSRWELSSTGSNVQPSWRNLTGGDTTWSVEITDSVVYTGGHVRWQNNAFAGDRAGQGAVSREGIAALDPVNGLPLSWNPTRTRGVGVFDFLVTADGLWVASDTDRINDYLRSRIALLPTAGSTSPGVRTPGLPNTLYAATSSGLSSRSATATAFGPATAAPAGPVTWGTTVKGAFMLNGEVYIASSDGSLVKRTFDGTSYGAAETVNTAGLIVPFTNWQSDIKAMTGMFYDSGRIYFTRSGSAALYYRYFTPESGVVGAERFQASANVTGVAFEGVTGMFLAGGRLYWSTTSGDLRSIGWNPGPIAGSPVAGTQQVVSGPAVDGQSWGSPKALFLFQDAEGDNAANAPVADFTADCTSLTCQFDATGSQAGTGTITSYAWSFGDGGTGAGATPTHTYATSGAREVTLTVTTSKGKSTTVTKSVTATKVNQAPVAVATASCAELTCVLDASGSSDANGDELSFAWDFGDGTTGVGARVEHTYAASGARTATVVVTDVDAASATATVEVAPTVARVETVGAVSTNGNRTAHSVVVPAAVRAGDRMLLFLTANASTVTVTGPAGWTLVPGGSVTADGIQGRLWTKVATEADAGTTVTATTSAYAKSDVSLAVYRASDGATLTLGETAGAARTAGGTAFTSPEVALPEGNAWVVGYWGTKASAATTWTAPSGDTARTASQGTGSGAVSAVVADSGAPLPGTVGGGRTATLSASSSRVVVYSVVLAASDAG